MSEFTVDGQYDFAGGQDSSKAPSRIGENCVAAAVNVSTNNGILSPRYALHKRPLKFAADAVEYQTGRFRTLKQIFEQGKYQAFIPYSIGSKFYTIVVISGIIFLIDNDTLEVQHIPIADGSRLDELRMRTNWSPAGKYLIIYDYPAKNVVIEGRTARRADLNAGEIPISRMGIYNQNRLIIANGGTEITASDPSGGVSTPNAPLTFFEILTGGPYVGQGFQVDSDYNNSPITAMGVLEAVDNGTGIGPCLVSTRSSIHAFQTQNARATWENGQFGIQLTSKVGIAGARALVNVNSDFFFMGSDGGVRSLSMARDEQRKWARLPMTQEVRNWLKFISPELIQYTALGYYDNRVFITANPYRIPAIQLNGRAVTDVAFGGLINLNMDNIVRMGNAENPPSWDGLWTGVRPMDMCVNDNRAFVISKDGYSSNAFYEMDASSRVDTYGRLKRVPTAIIYTREHFFKDAFVNKEAHSIDFDLEQVKGDFSIDIKYKPHHAENFVDWSNFRHKAPACEYEIPDGEDYAGYVGHSFRSLVLSAPDDHEASEVTDDPYKVFRKVQFKMIIRGEYWELQAYKLNAILKPESPTLTNVDNFKEIKVSKKPNTDWAEGVFV
jgi:hypothetical protein